MEPTLLARQIVIGRRTQKFQTGDVVILSHDGLEKIKRVNKRQGDIVYLLGDNRRASTDSRSFGWVKVTNIVAKVVWPKV